MAAPMFLLLAVSGALLSTVVSATPPLCADLAALQASVGSTTALPTSFVTFGSATCIRTGERTRCDITGDVNRFKQLFVDTERQLDACLGHQKVARQLSRELDAAGTLVQANLARAWGEWDMALFFSASKKQLTFEASRVEGRGKPLPAVVDWTSLAPTPENCAELKTLLARPSEPKLWDLQCEYVTSQGQPDLASKHEVIRCTVPRLPPSGGIAGAYDGVSRALSGCLTGFSRKNTEMTDERESHPARYSTSTWIGPSWRIDGVYADRTGSAIFHFTHRP